VRVQAAGAVAALIIRPSVRAPVKVATTPVDAAADKASAEVPRQSIIDA
jgi:hypothetical protein